MSTIAAGTTTGTALVSTGDTSGNLVLQVNGTTTAVTLNTAGAVGVGSSPSYGTSGQLLTSAGSAAAPTWTTVASSPTTLISTQTASSSSSVEWTGLTLNQYFLVWQTVGFDASGVDMIIEVGTGGTPTYATSGYSSTLGAFYNVTTDVYATTSTTNFIVIKNKTSVGIASGNAYFYSLQTSNAGCTGTTFYRNGTPNQYTATLFGGQWSGSGPVTALRVKPASSTMSGTFSLYGVSQ